MKIIGESQEVFKQATCQNCGSVLEYAPIEVKPYHGKGYSGGADGKDYIDCPRCGKEVILRGW